MAAACIIDDTVNIEGITDSKATTEESRVASYEKLVSDPGVTYAVVRIEHNEIDDINILQATMKAMRLAAESVLQKKTAQLAGGKSKKDKLSTSDIGTQCVALVDGNRVPTDMPMSSEAIIKVR